MNSVCCRGRQVLARGEVSCCQWRVDHHPRHSTSKHALAFLARLVAFPLMTMIAMLVRWGRFLGVSMMRAASQQRMRNQRNKHSNG